MNYRPLIVLAAIVVSSLLAAAPARAQGCVTGISPNPLVVPANAAPVTITVQTSSPDCSWVVTNLPTWLNFPDQFGGTGPGSVRFSRALPNHVDPPRTGSVLIGGVSFPVQQPANPCPLTISPPTVTAPANGGSGSFTVNTTGTSCSYSVSPGDGITITSGQSGSAFPATVSYTVPPNTTSNPQIRSALLSSLGTFFFAPGIGIIQNGAPIVTDAPPHGFLFSVYRPTSGPVHHSPNEIVQLTNTEDPGGQWTASQIPTWLRLTPSSGATPETMTLTVDQAAAAMLAAGVYSADLRLLSSIAPVTPRLIHVTLRVTEAATNTIAPGGYVDTPAQNASGLGGAVAVTGWAVDDVGIARVQVYRDAFGTEPPGPVYLGDATRVRGARPDVVQAFLGGPEVTRAGWGFMILSNMLPNGGNGAFTLFAIAEDIEGHRTLLGARSVTFDNTSSPFPFGTIDFPIQGGTMSGTYANQGWVLAQPGRSIPLNGSTLRLLIDGVVQPNPASYNHARPDVAALFPNPPYANSSGPAAQFTIDTTQLANGLHTMAWTATDDGGVTQGIGSRYVDVRNEQGPITEPLAARSAALVNAVPLATAFVWDRRGFDDREWGLQFAGASVKELRSRPGERIEIAMDTWVWSRACGPFAGYLESGDVAGPLPPGASLDGDRGVFRWMPPAEFAGTFDFAFVRRTCGGPGDDNEERIPLRIVIESQDRVR
jgi:hypothetical protein